MYSSRLCLSWWLSPNKETLHCYASNSTAGQSVLSFSGKHSHFWKVLHLYYRDLFLISQNFPAILQRALNYKFLFKFCPLASWFILEFGVLLLSNVTYKTGALGKPADILIFPKVTCYMTDLWALFHLQLSVCVDKSRATMAVGKARVLVDHVA